MKKRQNIVLFADGKKIIGPHSYRILLAILPSGQQRGNEYVVLNPTRPDSRPGSFKINTGTWRWAEFAENQKGSSGSDIIALYAYVRRKTQLEALHDLLEMVGVQHD